MFLGEPPATAADLHFRLFGFPVRVHPFFWLAAIMLTGAGRREVEPLEAVIWVAVVFVSILVHELGHAFFQRRFGGRPWITLYAFGGLASCSDCDRSPRRQILISLAGPMAGFLLAATTALAIRAAGHPIGLQLWGSSFQLGAIGISDTIEEPLFLFDIVFQRFASDAVNNIVWDLMQVNIMWGLVNLLPIYPLDGGQVARELLTLGNARNGIVRSLQLSIGTATLVAIYAVTQEKYLTALMLGLLAYSSFQALAAYRNHWQ